MSLSALDWMSVMRREYLRSFLPNGGATVKFVVAPDPQSRQAIQAQLQDATRQDGFLFAEMNARYVKVHMMDRVFHKVAKQVDWDGLAYAFLARLLRENGYQLPPDRAEFQLAHLARLNDREESLLRRDLCSWVEKGIYRHPGMCQEFRLAMVRLCLAQLDGEDNPFLANSIKDWLRGEIRSVSVLKDALIFQKVARHNARHMLASLTHWLRILGKPGLVITIDISRYLVARKPAEPDTTYYYTASAVMDAYEVLRQCIDGTDEMVGCLVVVLVPPEFISDDRRGLNRYEALKLRIWDDVRDKHRPNPFAPLVRLSSELPAGSVDQVETGQNPEMPLGNAQAMGYRRAVEALRAGVPNTDAVQALGCVQPDIEGRFRRLLDQVQSCVRQGHRTQGILLDGGFGTGKSHTLGYLEELALENNFVCSRLVISKETPLYNPAKMFRSAIESMKVPGKRGGTLREIADELNFRSLPYGEFYEWVHGENSGMDDRLSASVFLYERLTNDRELSHRLVRFWSGDPVTTSDLRRWVRACSARNPYTFFGVSSTDLACQRSKFVARLMQAAGYSGWIWLIDEVEIIGRYSLRQRAKSYAEMARWLGVLGEPGCRDVTHQSGIAAVVALTDDFQTAVLDGKGDRNNISIKLGASQTEADRILGEQAEIGIRVIDTSRTSLASPYVRMIEDVRDKVRAIHGAAYEWDPPDPVGMEHTSGMRMREHVKGWITQWDLKRLNPDLGIHLEVNPFRIGYQEDRELEMSTDTGIADRGGEIDCRMPEKADGGQEGNPIHSENILVGRL